MPMRNLLDTTAGMKPNVALNEILPSGLEVRGFYAWWAAKALVRDQRATVLWFAEHFTADFSDGGCSWWRNASEEEGLGGSEACRNCFCGCKKNLRGNMALSLALAIMAITTE